MAVGGDMETVVAEVAGERLAIRAKELRGERTLIEVATHIGIRQDDLGRIECGETQSIRFETFLKLCAFFKVSAGELFKVESIVHHKANSLERTEGM
jgi:DNA-binding Xre family transcriptional regulator